jgi:hypothetical protein
MHQKESRWGKQGNIAIMAAGSMALMLGFAALILDVGQLHWTRTREITAAEAAALAAVQKLNYTPAGLTAACNEAAALVNANANTDGEFAFSANCSNPTASTNEIKFGVWENNIFTSSTEAIAINAVKVEVKRTSAKQNAITPILAGFLGFFGGSAPTSFDMSGSAIVAMPDGNPPGQANIFPIAATDCSFMKGSNLACGREIILGDNPGGTTAMNCPHNPTDCVIDDSGNHFNWTTGTDSHGGTSTFRGMANDLVTCLTTGICNPVQIELGDTIYLKGGNHAGTFNSGVSLFPDYLALKGTVDVQIPIFDGGSCSTTHSHDDSAVTVVGFGTFRINQIVSTGSNKYVRGTVICDVTIDQPGDKNSQDLGTVTPGQASIVK